MAKSLTEQYRPEFDRLVQTTVRLGWVFPQWKGPEFKVRRTRRFHGVSGKGCFIRVSLQIGGIVDDALVHETIAHELAHALTMPDDHGFEEHGPAFRTKLRQLVRAHWPDIAPWEETDQPGARWAYIEDGRIIKNLHALLSGPRKHSNEYPQPESSCSNNSSSPFPFPSASRGASALP
jgi:hypothetical protein